MPAASQHWAISVISTEKAESFSLADTTPIEDVKFLIRLIAARGYTPSEVFDSFKFGGGWSADRFKINESVPGTQFNCGQGEPAVYARLEAIPAEKH